MQSKPGPSPRNLLAASRETVDSSLDEAALRNAIGEFFNDYQFQGG
jgi:hypothetical protein